MQFLGAGNCSLHAFFRGSEDELRAKEGEKGPALEAHTLWHGEGEAIALGSGDEGEGDAGIARGGLDDLGLRSEAAVALGGLDHCNADAVFDAAEGVKELRLEGDRGLRAVRDAVELDERRPADGAEDVGMNRHEDA